MAIVYLGLGSNLGDRIANIRVAISLIRQMGGIAIRACSSLYEGKAMGNVDQPDFVNCVIAVETNLEPRELLTFLKSIEQDMGREPESHWQPRPIDIDILLYDDIDLESLELKIPHSRLRGRRFALEPLLEIAPDIVDPTSSRPLRDSLAGVISQEIRKVMDASEVMDDSGQ